MIFVRAFIGFHQNTGVNERLVFIKKEGRLM